MSDRKPQRQKPASVTRVQNIRFSGAAGIHAGQGEYRRKQKHEIWEEALEELDDLGYWD
jgi:hypothetical protein